MVYPHQINPHHERNTAIGRALMVLLTVAMMGFFTGLLILASR